MADVGDAQALSAAADAAVAAFGPFDSWVHAAGVAIYAPLLETPADEHERLFRTNYWGVVNASRVAVPALRPRGGAFVVVGSVASDIGTPVLGAYAASKHAVKGFIDSLRIELLAERAPVSVTLVKPSGIGTPLAEHAANHQGAAAKVPPPAYSPEVAARAILHAVQHPRREIIVGGVGAFQRAGAILAPGLADRISSLVPPHSGIAVGRRTSRTILTIRAATAASARRPSPRSRSASTPAPSSTPDSHWSPPVWSPA